MESNEKKKLKEYISEFIDISNNRLTDDEVLLLVDLIDNTSSYSDVIKESKSRGWGSEGSYTMFTTDKYHINSDYTIEHYEKVGFDDGSGSRESTIIISEPREIIRTLRKHF